MINFNRKYLKKKYNLLKNTLFNSFVQVYFHEAYKLITIFQIIWKASEVIYRWYEFLTF